MMVFRVNFRFFDLFDWVRLGSISSEIERNRTLSHKCVRLLNSSISNVGHSAQHIRLHVLHRVHKVNQTPQFVLSGSNALSLLLTQLDSLADKTICTWICISIFDVTALTENTKTNISREQNLNKRCKFQDITVNVSGSDTTLEEFENAALFLRLGLPSTLIRHENGAFENALQTGGIWKRRLFVFVWTENILKTELFENDGVTIIMWYPWPSFPQTQIQNDRWLLRF